MLSWVSEERAFIAAIVIILLLLCFTISIFIGVKQTAFREKDEVFGDPERTLGGWYWTVTGVSSVLLLWFYFSWGIGRAFFPEAGNEMCQIAKLETAIAPITATLPINTRYFKSTTLTRRNSEQLEILLSSMPTSIFTKIEQTELIEIIENSKAIIGIFSNQKNQSKESVASLKKISSDLRKLSVELRLGFDGYLPTKEALAQPNWGTTNIEIPLLPITSKGGII